MAGVCSANEQNCNDRVARKSLLQSGACQARGGEQLPGWVVSCTATSCSRSRGRPPHSFAPANYMHKCTLPTAVLVRHGITEMTPQKKRSGPGVVERQDKTIFHDLTCVQVGITDFRWASLTRAIKSACHTATTGSPHFPPTQRGPPSMHGTPPS